MGVLCPQRGRRLPRRLGCQTQQATTYPLPPVHEIPLADSAAASCLTPPTGTFLHSVTLSSGAEALAAVCTWHDVYRGRHTRPCTVATSCSRRRSERASLFSPSPHQSSSAAGQRKRLPSHRSACIDCRRTNLADHVCPDALQIDATRAQVRRPCPACWNGVDAY